MLVTLAHARRLLRRRSFVAPVVHATPVVRSTGRLAGATVRAPGNLPPASTSAMDGYAVRVGRGVALGPLRVRGASFPSSARRPRPLRPGEASYIATGAALPPGANAVVRVEATHRLGERLTLRSPPAPGQDVVPPGEAMRRGEVIVRRGELIRPPHVAALVAHRFRTVPIFDPLVTVLPIGDELVPPTGANDHGTPDSIGPVVAALLYFARVDLRPPTSDDPARIAAALRSASRRSDLVVTIGGSSVGAKDQTKRVVAGLGEVWFEGVRTNVLKRGAVGRVGKTPVVILPGQLVSAVAAFHEHGLHVLGRMVGCELRQFETAVLGEGIDVRHRMDTTYLFRVVDGVATPLPWGVGRLTALLGAQAQGILQHGRTYGAGERIELQRFSFSP